MIESIHSVFADYSVQYVCLHVQYGFDSLARSVCLCVALPSVQEYTPIGTGHNRRAQPFMAAASLDDKRQVVSSSYNTPIGLYSSGNIQDALHGQIRGLAIDKPEG